MTGLIMQIPQVMTSDAVFWEKRYQAGTTGWDIGYASPPITNFINQLQDKTIVILIPGAGNAYEAEYLYKNGFQNVHILDIAAAPLKNFKDRNPGFPDKQILQQDFFKVSGKFDLILEQTFFCALPVEKRKAYAEKCHEILKNGGKLVGVLFNFPLSESGPPFGGSKKEYLTYFSDKFFIETMEPCYNSIKPRQGNELFIKLRKR